MTRRGPVDPVDPVEPVEPVGPVGPAGPVDPAAPGDRADPAEGEMPVVHGPTVDAQTRCIHYRTPLDVIALRFACCGEYYPCHLCHEETAVHASRPWPASSRHERAVLCGVCWSELTIAQYLQAEDCPYCAAAFNPGCALHHELYFE